MPPGVPGAMLAGGAGSQPNTRRLQAVRTSTSRPRTAWTSVTASTARRTAWPQAKYRRGAPAPPRYSRTARPATLAASAQVGPAELKDGLVFLRVASQPAVQEGGDHVLFPLLPVVAGQQPQHPPVPPLQPGAAHPAASAPARPSLARTTRAVAARSSASAASALPPVPGQPVIAAQPAVVRLPPGRARSAPRRRAGPAPRTGCRSSAGPGPATARPPRPRCRTRAAGHRPAR